MTVLVASNLALPRRFLFAFGASPPFYYDMQRLLEVLAVGAIVLIVAASADLRRNVVDTFLTLPALARWALAGVFLLGSWSATRAEVPSAAFREVAIFACLLAVGMIVATARRLDGRRFEREALIAIFLTAFTYLVLFVVMELSVERGVAMYGFDNRRLFGQVGLWTFPFLVAAAIHLEEGRVARYALWATAVLWWTLIIESDGRSALFGTTLALLLVPLVLGRRGRRWAGGALAAMVAGTSVWLAWSSWLGDGTGGLYRVAAKGLDGSGRLALWQESLELARAHPFLGVGPEHYAYHGILASPHSAPLQLLAEWGIPAALLLVTLGGWAAWSWVRSLRLGPDEPAARASRDPVIASALTAALIAASFASLLEGMLVTPISQLMLAGAGGWMLGRHRQDAARSDARRGAHALIAVAVLAAAVLLVIVVPQSLDQREAVVEFAREHPGETLSPRFWVQGRLGLGAP